MADVIYKRGLDQNLNSVDVQDGQILVTADKGEMYVDFTSGRKKITDTSKQDRIGAVEKRDVADFGEVLELTLDNAAVNRISFDNQIYISGPQGTYGVDAQNISEFAKTITIEGNNSIDIASQGDSIQLGDNNGLSLRSSTSEINVNNNRISNLVAPETDDQAANKAYVDTKINELQSAALKREIVDSLPAAADAKTNVIYMVPDTEAIENNVYLEYMLVKGTTQEYINLEYVGPYQEAGTYTGTMVYVGHVDDTVTGYYTFTFDKGDGTAVTIYLKATNDGLAIKERVDIGTPIEITFNFLANKIDKITIIGSDDKFELIGSTQCNMDSKANLEIIYLAFQGTITNVNHGSINNITNGNQYYIYSPSIYGDSGMVSIWNDTQDTAPVLFIDFTLEDGVGFVNAYNRHQTNEYAPVVISIDANQTITFAFNEKTVKDVKDKQDKLVMFQEDVANTTAKISADALNLIGRTFAPQEKIYDIIYQGGSGQTTGVIYEFSHAETNSIYHDWVDENINSGFSYTSDTVIDLPAGTKFKFELDENYYTDEAERAQALERLAMGQGDDQHIKLVAYVTAKVPGGDMPINGVSKIVSDSFTLETHSSTIDLIGVSWYEYDIELIGIASDGFTEGTTYGFAPDPRENVGDKLWYSTGVMEGGGANFYVLNTEKNKKLPPLENVGIRGSFFTLSNPADSTGPALLKVKPNTTTGVSLSINANNLHFASMPSSYQYDIRLVGSASHNFTEGVVSYIDEFETFEEELSVDVTLDDGTDAGVMVIIPNTDNNYYLPEISKILVPGTRIHLSRGSQSTGEATLSFTVEVPDDSIRLKNIATPIDATDAVNKAYVDALDNVLKDIRDAIRGGGTTEQTVAQIEQLITNYLETKTVAEVEE